MRGLEVAENTVHNFALLFVICSFEQRNERCHKGVLEVVITRKLEPLSKQLKVVFACGEKLHQARLILEQKVKRVTSCDLLSVNTRIHEFA